MFMEVAGVVERPLLLVADAYYASAKVIMPLLREGHGLITRVRKNGVAFECAVQPKKHGRGRPKKYGRKVQLRQLFKAANAFIEAPSPVYGEASVVIKYRCVDLLWRPAGQVMRFVLVKHPTRGMVVLLCSKVELDPIAVIRIYGLRFKIEVSFKHALHTLGAYGYHFWMKNMKPIKWGSGDQRIENATKEYKEAVARKLDAYNRYIQIGCVLQGLLQHLAINFRAAVWAQFRSWLRTMRPDLVPTEMVVAQALKSSLPNFLMDSTNEPDIKKFILDRAEVGRTPGLTAEAA